MIGQTAEADAGDNLKNCAPIPLAPCISRMELDIKDRVEKVGRYTIKGSFSFRAMHPQHCQEYSNPKTENSHHCCSHVIGLNKGKVCTKSGQGTKKWEVLFQGNASPTVPGVFQSKNQKQASLLCTRPRLGQRKRCARKVDGERKKDPWAGLCSRNKQDSNGRLDVAALMAVLYRDLYIIFNARALTLKATSLFRCWAVCGAKGIEF
jgi:hypothetical protein